MISCTMRPQGMSCGGQATARRSLLLPPPPVSLRRPFLPQRQPGRPLRPAGASSQQQPAAAPQPQRQPAIPQQQQQQQQQSQQDWRLAAPGASPPPRLVAAAARLLLRPGVLLGLAACCALAALLPPAALAAKAQAAAAGASAAAAGGGGGGLAALAKQALSFVLHLDHHLGELVAKYGATTYAILFGIVFAETGLVVTPFLPGDSLLFATGALAALGKLSLPALLGCYVVAATLGDAVNYAIGNALGSAALSSRLVKKEYIEKTEEFYMKYGGKTVVLARFVPIVRTFAPFVAGVGSMSYRQFALYNVAGALLWTAVCVGAGFAFGNVPAVHENFSLVVLGIVAVSLLPIAWEVYAAKREAAAKAAAKAAQQVPHATAPGAAEALEDAGLPPRISPQAVAAAGGARELAKEKVQEYADPLEQQRQEECEQNPDLDQCRVWD